MAEIALGRTEDGGLGWRPSDFWESTVYDLERALAISRRRAGAISREEARQMEMMLRDQHQREAEERAAAGDRRTRAQVIRDLMETFKLQGAAQ